MTVDILFVSSKYHRHVGGVQTQMRIIAQELAGRHRISVATLFAGRESFLDGAIPVHALKLSATDRGLMLAHGLIPKPFRSVRSRIGYQFYRAVYLPKLRPLVRGKNVVHALKPDALSRVAQEAARLEGVPFAITPYFHPSENARAAAGQREAAAFCNRADAVFALLETDRDMLVRLGIAKERIRLAGVMPLLPKTSDPEAFRARHGLVGKPVVLFLGRMIEAKGCKAILEAAARVWQELPDVHFLLAGPGDDAARRWFAERSDLRIRNLGLVEEQEKGDALAACDLFCLPSTAEILPAVYLEAWSYGKAVIGGSAHGLRELIDDNGAGRTVKQDPGEIAAQLIELLQDEPRRREMGQRGRELVAQRFSKASLVDALEQAYETLHHRKLSASLDIRKPDRSQATALSGSHSV
jgi:glycosyltransferase involved in cell wall biosynthesis